MKLSCLQENLVRGIAVVSHAVATKGSLPILSNLLLRTDEGRLRLAATNLETSIVTWVGAKVEEEGEITVPARLFSDLVGSLNPGKIELSLKNQILSVRTENAYSRLSGIAAEEFPAFPAIPKKALFKLEASLLAKALPLVTFAAASDEDRPVLTGVLFGLESNRILLVGVDGFRLSEKILTVAVGVEEPLALIIPARTLDEAARLISDSGEVVEVFLPEGENQVVFRSQNVQIFSRLLEGSFPDYKRIVPRDFSTELKLPREGFAKAVRLAALFAKDSANIVKLKIESDKGKITFSANTADVGENETYLEASVEGEPSEVAFNAKYLLDCLGHLPEGEVLFKLSGPLSPGLLRPVADKDFFHLIMPVRLQS